MTFQNLFTRLYELIKYENNNCIFLTRKLQFKTILKLVAIIILSFTFSFTTVFASTTKLDLTNNRVIGQNGDYFFKIPISWQNYISAERESGTGYGYYDKINFYYEPRDLGDTRSFLMSLFVYKSSNYIFKGNEKFVKSTGDYTFTIQCAAGNPYDSVNDRIIFGRFIVEMGTLSFISPNIVNLGSSTLNRTNSVIVNNELLSDNTILINNTLYLPIRSVVTKLGYAITWISTTKTIAIAKNSDSLFLKMNNTNKKNYTPVIRNGVAYLPLAFYMKRLNCSVEVDSNNNVKINS